MTHHSAPSRRLSVVVLARDEESVLPLTLASVQGIADEILLIDTGSTDGTPRVAREFGARVIEAPWTDDFSAARNRAWAELTGDWVLWIDSGEQLGPESRAPLREFIDTMADPERGYLLLVELPPVDTHAATEQRGCLRLVPRRSGMRFHGRVRETLEVASDAEGLEVELLPLRLLRHPRDHERTLRRQRARRNLRLAEKEQVERGPVPRLLLMMADAHAALGVWVLAQQYYRDTIDRAPPDSTELLEGYYGLLTALEHLPAGGAQALDVCLEGLTRFPLDAQLLCAAAGYLQNQGQPELATRSYELAWRSGQSDPRTWHVRDINAMAAACLALSLQLAGDDARARTVLEAALADAPRSVAARRQLIDLHIKHGREGDALAELDRLPGAACERELMRNAVRGACQLAGQNWISAVAYLQSSYSAGCRDPLCLRWLSVALYSTGCAAEALPVVDEWLRIEPRNIEAKRYRSELTAIDALRPASFADSADRVTVTAPVNIEWLSTTIAAGESTFDLPAQTHIIQPPSTGLAAALGELVVAAQQVQQQLDMAMPTSVPAPLSDRDVEAALADYRAGRYEPAAATLRRAIQSGRTEARLWQHAAQALLRLRRSAEAEPLVREWLLREPGNSTAHELLAQVLSTTGRHAEARVVLDQLRRLEGLLAGPHFPAAAATAHKP